ncbi:ATP-dependent 6-phosphofructokinase 4, chloroplastic-like [Aristolochia californica]|uniref:ATP-dependent 6-phosphofructokinase 4, chloroplastic-like n=1 Tax=Aristolochia californica TaxID=171875 RepID=UPI0035D6FD4E
MGHTFRWNGPPIANHIRHISAGLPFTTGYRGGSVGAIRKKSGGLWLPDSHSQPQPCPRKPSWEPYLTKFGEIEFFWVVNLKLKLGRKVFVSKTKASGVPTNCELHKTVLGDGHVVNVIDTPGLFDMLLIHMDIVTELVRCLALSKDEIHAVLLKIVVQKNSQRRVHFRRAGPQEKVYFNPHDVKACIVTCGGLCPGIHTVIQEIVCGLNIMYGMNDILAIQGGYRGFYSKTTIPLTAKVVNDIHKHGGTFLCTSLGGHDTMKIVDGIQDRDINPVYTIEGHGTQKGAYATYEEIEKRKLPVAVAGIPKTIDNDIVVIGKSFDFNTAVEDAQRPINVAHVAVEIVENGVGIVKVMGRYSGFISTAALHYTDIRENCNDEVTKKKKNLLLRLVALLL